jgi:hypothetical protein
MEFLQFVESDGKINPFSPKQAAILSYETITFMLGTHFNSPPHEWNDQPVERVMLDYLFLRVYQEQERKEADKAKRDAKRYNTKGSRHKGRPLRTTSDDAVLGDFFDRVNQDLRDE